MNLLEKFAGKFCECNEYLTDVMGKEGRSGRGEREDLQSMDYGGAVSVPGSPDRVIVNRMIICRDGLKGGGVRVSQGTAWRSKNVAYLQIFEAAGWNEKKVLRVEIRLCLRGN